MTIAAFADVPEVATGLTEFLKSTWPDWYGPDGPGDAARDVAARCRSRGLPLGLVALGPSGSVEGTAALGARSHGARGAEGPWLIGLAVHPDRRLRGIGSALAAEAEDRARGAGHDRIYAATKLAAGLLRRRGWEDLRTHPDGTKILRLDLQA